MRRAGQSAIKFMSIFVVDVSIYAPYAFSYQFTIKASSAHTAAARGVQEAYKSLPPERRRRIDYYSVRVKRG